jgi:tyrosine decarboxylase/aspartate 1-decarboxylase
MLKNGLAKDEIRSQLEKLLDKDYSYDSGSILGSMCTLPYDFGKEIYLKYIYKNLGDPGLFQGTAALEKELVREIGELFHGKGILGAIVSGGSEANIIAMRMAKRSHPEIKHPEIVAPQSAHASFDKGADLLGIKLKKARLKPNFDLDLDHFRSLISKNTCGVVGIAGTTSLGLVDPIRQIGEYVADRQIFFHVDAAFGGFILPFLTELGYQIPNWDFIIKEVDSITADPHKMGLGVIPTGGLFLRDEKVLQEAGFEIPYLAGGNFKHLHLVGTRPGAAVISFWAILKHLGVEGFKAIIKTCMENTEFLVNGISKIQGIKIAAKSLMNVVGITTINGESVCEMDVELRKRNWMLGKFLNFNLIRIVLMPHVTKNHLSRFLADLSDITKKLKLG